MTALSSYSTGTATVSAYGTTITGTGTIWSGTNVKPGDIFQIGDFQSVISDVTDTTHLVIPPWGGGAQTGVSYTIWQVSPQRFAGAQAMGTVNELVAAFNTSGFFIFVDIDETVPDPSLGDDGQYAFQPTTGKTWAKVSGTWTYLGIYKGFNLTGAWSGATAYTVGDVVTLSGSSYVCILDHTNHTPPNATYWQVLASKGDTGALPLNPIAAWVTSHAYVAGPPADYVSNGGSSYMCLVSHTSGTFATDLAAGKWGLVSQAGASYGGTSTTSLSIGAGSKAFTTQAGLAYTNGARVRATATAGATGWLEGVATYSGTTLTITSDKTSGSGTGTAWTFNVAGEPGTGVTSIAGNTGAFTLGSGLTNSTNDIQVAAGVPLRTVQAVDTTNRTVSSTSYAASGSISSSVTPAASANKLRIQISGILGVSTSLAVYVTIYRSINGGSYTDITPGGVGEMQSTVVTANVNSSPFSIDFLDSPATTQSVQYQIYMKSSSAGTVYLGRRGSDTLLNSPTIISVTEIKG